MFCGPEWKMWAPGCQLMITGLWHPKVSNSCFCSLRTSKHPCLVYTEQIKKVLKDCNCFWACLIVGWWLGLWLRR